MKKYLLIFVVVLAIVMYGCQATDTNTNDQLNDEQTNAIETHEKSEFTENISIIIESLDQIDDIKAILNEDNETKATESLLSLQGAGLKSKEDLTRFLEVINDLPILNLIDGEITTISYMKGLTEDTGKEYEFAYITVKANNGSWVRFEYLLNKDISATIDDTISSTEEGVAIFSEPVKFAEGKVEIFTKQSQEHPSGVGNLFTWNASINGINTRVIYYTKGENQLNTAEVFSSVNVSMINKEETQ